ncbi:hypothetical protein D3C86_1992820 [compost metagenome]
MFFLGEKSAAIDTLVGRFCKIQIKNGPCVLGMLRRGYAPGTWAISGPFSADSVSVSWAAPVLITRN